MSGLIIRLGPGECSDIETGARYFAALAFPGRSEEEARQNAVAAWVGSYLHEANRVDGTDAPFQDGRLNEFVRLDPAWCRARLRTVKRRLEDRSLLALALRPWVREMLGDPHPPVAGIKRFTQRQIALYLCNGDPERAAKFQSRVWRPGRPVMHLAVAYDRVLCGTGAATNVFTLDIAEVDVVRQLVAAAHLVEKFIRDDPRFRAEAETLLCLEWVQ